MSLGQSARLCPDLEAGLRTSLPDGHPLDTRGAFAFLTEKALLLEQAGFGVMLPAWWSGRGAKMRLSARAQVKSPKMAGGSGLNLDQIVRFDWQLALGDEDLSLAELQELAELKSPLVKVRGQWVQLNAEEIQAALDFWRKKADGRDHRPGGPANGPGRRAKPRPTCPSPDSPPRAGSAISWRNCKVRPPLPNCRPPTPFAASCGPTRCGAIPG